MANVIEIRIRQTNQGNTITTTAKDLGNLDRVADNSTSTLSRLGTTMGTLTKVAVGLGAVGLVGIGVGLTKAVGAGLSFNNTMEQAEAKINAFTKDAGLTAQMLEQVRAEAAKTPFEFDQMANAFAGLIPVARQADVEVMDLLRDAEILAASNPAEGLEGAAFALREAVSGDFTSVIERFNLPRSMINELKEKGVPDLEIVRTAMKNMGYDMDLVSALANTAEGRWSTFKDTLTNLAGTVTQPLFDALSTGLGNVNDWLTLVSPQLEGFSQMLAGQVAGAMNTVVTSITKIVGGFQRFGVRGAAVSILGQLGLDPTQIASVMGVASQIIGVIDQITATITTSLGKISGAYERFGAKGAAISILGQLGMDPETIGLIRTTFDTIVEKIGTLQQIYAQFGAMGAGVSLLSMMGLSSESIALITTSIQTVMDSLNSLANWWIATWPIVQAAALTGWEILQGIFVGFQTALGPVLTQLQVQFTEVFNQISQTLASLGITWPEVWNTLLTATGIVAAGIGAAIMGVIGVVAGLATGIGEGISAAITMFQNLATNVTGIFTGLTVIFVGWVETFKALIAGDFTGALEGLKIVLQGSIDFWSNMWGGMITVATGTLNIISSTISGFAEGVVGFFQGLYNQLVGHSIIPDMVNDIVAWFKKLPQMILTALGDLKTKVLKPFQDMAVVLKSEVGDAISYLNDDLLPLMRDGFDYVTEGVKDFVSSIKEAASTLADMVIPDWLEMHSPPPLATAFNMIASEADTAALAVQGFMQRIAAGASLDGGSIQKAISGQIGFAARWFMGKENMEEDERNTAKAALKNAFDQTFNAITAGTAGATEFLAAFRQGLKDFDQTEITEAMGVASDHINEIIGTIRSQFGPLTLEMKAQALSIAGNLSSVAGNFASMLQGQMDTFRQATAEADKLGQANINLSKTVEDQQSKLTALQVDLAALTSVQELDTEAIERKQAAIAELTAAMDRNRETIQRNEQAIAAHRAELENQAINTDVTGDLARIELLQDFLEGNENLLQIWGQRAGEDVMTGFTFNRIQAQEELNRLLEEQAEREAEIARQQEAQQNLNFLQMQLDLLRQGQALGVNVFEGMQFGLEASASDLLAATNNLVDAMINEIDSSLQIASPSKVLFRKFKDQVGGAMIRGLMAVRPTLEGVTNSMLNPLSSDSSRTTNNYFNQTVNTRADSSSVIGDFRTMQLMVGG